MSGEGAIGDIFAAAHQGVGSRQRLERRVEAEGLVQGIGEPMPAGALAQQPLRRLAIADCGMASNRTFHQGPLAAAEAGAFTCGVNAGQRRLLPVVHGNRVMRHGAAQGLGQLDVGDQAEAAGQPVTGDFHNLAVLHQAHTFQAIATQCGKYMAGAAVLAVEQAEGLQQFLRPARQLRGEAGDGGGRSLFGDAQHPGAVGFGGGGTG
ncbi:hypothetical protein D3C80_1416870 [compost metagenome]